MAAWKSRRGSGSGSGSGTSTGTHSGSGTGTRAGRHARAEFCEGVQSTCIASMSYDGKEQMTLVFQSGGTYKYHGVGPEEYKAFCKAESKGKHFHRFVRGRYPFVKVS